MTDANNAPRLTIAQRIAIDALDAEPTEDGQWQAYGSTSWHIIPLDELQWLGEQLAEMTS